MTKTNKSLIIALVLVVGFLGVVIITKPAPDVGNNLTADLSSAVISGERFFDFGSVSMAAGNVSHEFKIKNNGSSAVEIEKMYTSCMCTTAYFVRGGEQAGPFGMAGHGFVPPLRKTIESGEEVTISVVFDPAAHGPAGIGLVQREVYLKDKAGNSVAVLGFRATVTP